MVGHFPSERALPERCPWEIQLPFVFEFYLEIRQMKHQFTESQRVVAEQIRDRYSLLHRGPSSEADRPRHLSLFRTTATYAYALYVDLREHGFPIEFDEHMICVRGGPPDHPDFFYNLHALDDLFEFLLPMFDADEK